MNDIKVYLVVNNLVNRFFFLIETFNEISEKTNENLVYYSPKITKDVRKNPQFEELNY